MNGKRTFMQVILLVVLVVLSACGFDGDNPLTQSPLDQPADEISTVPTPLAADRKSTELLFLSEREGVAQWYAMRVDDTNVRSFSLPPEYVIVEITWSPDLGQFIAVLNVNGQDDLFLLDINGAITHQLTTTITNKGGPVYSPITGMVAYICVEYDVDVCVVPVSGGESRNITQHFSRDTDLVWSPVQDELLFVSNRSGVPDIWKIKSDGTGLRNLTLTGQPNGSPNWLPDGQKIIFASQRDLNWEVYVMDAEGGAPLNLTNQPGVDIAPKCSPDGQYTAFLSDRIASADIYVMRSNDGSALVNLTNTPNIDEVTFLWMPDSQRIIYVSDVNGNMEIYSVRLDGTDLVNLTKHAAADYSPVLIVY